MWRCLRHPTFSRFSRTPTCDRQTHRQTHRQTDRQTHDHGIYRESIARAVKNVHKIQKYLQMRRSATKIREMRYRLLFRPICLYLLSVREHVFYVFSDFKKTWLFAFFELACEKVVSKSLVLNPSKQVNILMFLCIDINILRKTVATWYVVKQIATCVILQQNYFMLHIADGQL